jgi:hypothetical protein
MRILILCKREQSVSGDDRVLGLTKSFYLESSRRALLFADHEVVDAA